MIPPQIIHPYWRSNPASAYNQSVTECTGGILMLSHRDSQKT